MITRTYKFRGGGSSYCCYLRTLEEGSHGAGAQRAEKWAPPSNAGNVERSWKLEPSAVPGKQIRRNKSLLPSKLPLVALFWPADKGEMYLADSQPWHESQSTG